MKYVRTVRSYQALTITEGEKTLTVNATPQEVSDENAKAIQKAADQYDVAVEVSDTEPDPATVRTPLATSVPDLSRGVATISGSGAPVETRTDAGEPTGEPETVAEAAGTPTEPATGTTTTTKGK